MSFFEAPDYCSREEYLAGIPQRIMPGQFEADGLYTLMLSLKNGRPNKEAIRLPGRILGLENLAGLSLVHFAILDIEFNPVHEAKSSFDNGYWGEAKHLAIDEEGQQVKTGYMKPFTYGWDGGLQEIAKSLDLAGTK